MKPLLLGMVRSDGLDGPALLPSTRRGNDSANRLLAISGMSMVEFMSKFRRQNLIDRGNWKQSEARIAGLLLRFKLKGKVIVLGKATWDALGLPKRAFFSKFAYGKKVFILLPHPSGRNLKCNSKATRTKMRRVLQNSERNK